jgi:hypothetical protein
MNLKSIKSQILQNHIQHVELLRLTANHTVWHQVFSGVRNQVWNQIQTQNLDQILARIRILDALL